MDKVKNFKNKLDGLYTSRYFNVGMKKQLIKDFEEFLLDKERLIESITDYLDNYWNDLCGAYYLPSVENIKRDIRLLIEEVEQC
jgi:hypothetical protein